jgi:hypothetical protein
VGCEYESIANSKEPIGALARRLLGVFSVFCGLFMATPVDK